MKQFRKNEQGFFICEECGNLCKSTKGLSSHIVRQHKLNKKEYFDKWIKEEFDDKCKICNNKTQFISVSNGYANCCCKKHINLYAYYCKKETMLKNYGVENVFQLENVKEKSKQTMLKNHGVEHALQSEEIKNNMKTNLLKDYGVDHNFKINDVIVNRKQTWTENYGYDNPSKSPVIKKQKEDTCLKHYGVKNQMQNKELFEKSQKRSYYLRHYKNTDVCYRGSFELDFLDQYYDIHPDIINAFSIKYLFEEKQHYYHPDFYIPSLNLIVECKNHYLAKKDNEKIKAKEKATIANDFKYIMILDKDYNEFNILM